MMKLYIDKRRDDGNDDGNVDGDDTDVVIWYISLFFSDCKSTLYIIIIVIGNKVNHNIEFI